MIAYRNFLYSAAQPRLAGSLIQACPMMETLGGLLSKSKSAGRSRERSPDPAAFIVSRLPVPSSRASRLVHFNLSTS